MTEVKERFDTYYEYATKYENYAQLMKKPGSQEFANGQLKKIAPRLVKAERKLNKSLDKLKTKLEKLQDRYKKLTSSYNRFKMLTHVHFEPKRRSGDDKEKYQRINISLPPNLKGKWAAKAEKFGVSLSEVLRYAMKELEDNLPDADEIQEELRGAEDEIKEAFEELGIKKKFKFNFDLGDNLKDEFPDVEDFDEIDEDLGGLGAKFRGFGEKKFSKSKKERQNLKKWARGIIMMNDNIPVSDFGEALDISPVQVKKLMYELSAMGVKLKLKKDVYYFDIPHEDLITKLNQVIDESDIF